MTQKVKYKIDDVTPEETVAILLNMSNGQGITKKELIETFERKGIFVSVRFRKGDALRRMMNLDLLKLQADRETYFLTEKGKALKDILVTDKVLYYEVMHILHYTGFDDKCPKTQRYFYTYKLICDELFKCQSFPVHQFLTSRVIDSLAQQFRTDAVSVSDTSVRWCVVWLKVLSPPFIDENRSINRRKLYYVQPFLLGLNYIYKLKQLPYSTPVLLTDETKEIICRCCLMDPAYFDETFDLVQRTYRYVRKNIGVSGASLILEREVTLGRLLSNE
jgi:hypothetical protein